MTNYIILLPPSEGKRKGGDESKPYRVVENLKKYNSFITLRSEREFVYDKLREAIPLLSQIELEKIFDVKEKKLLESIELLSDLLNQSTIKAIERYDGVMFKAINYELMSNNQKENFEKSVIFIDGLFGLLRASDLIPNYKLKISSKFLDLDLTKYWKENLYGLFDYLFKEKIIIDILPEAHRKVVHYSSGKKHFVIKFCMIKNDKLVNVGHESKRLKGEIVNYIVSKDNITRKDLEEFEHSDGFRYSEEFSKGNELIYLK